MILRDYIKSSGIRFGDFADRINVSRQTLYLYSTGKRFPRPATLRRIHDETEGQVTANDFADHVTSSPPSEAEARQ